MISKNILLPSMIKLISIKKFDEFRGCWEIDSQKKMKKKDEKLIKIDDSSIDKNIFLKISFDIICCEKGRWKSINPIKQKVLRTFLLNEF